MADLEIRGRIAADGTRLYGSGFKITHSAGSGVYQIDLDVGDNDIEWPTIVATASGNSRSVGVVNDGGNKKTFTISIFDFKDGNDNFKWNASDTDFNFIVMADFVPPLDEAKHK